MRKIKEPVELHEHHVCCDLQCLRTLVTCGYGRMERAVEIMEMGSASAVCLLLNRENLTTEELDKALISALVWKFPECLDALLKRGEGRRKAFDSINPYHVLLTFCSYYFSDYTSPTSNILESLRVLTSYPDLDINCKELEGSYPLYTLIHITFACYFPRLDTPSQQPMYTEWLKMLLQAGANPNFDEIKDGNGVRAVPRHKDSLDVFRTWRFSSALNGVFLSLENVRDVRDEHGCLYRPIRNRVWMQHVFELLGQACRLLLQHGSNPNHINLYTGTTPLHDLMALWARQYSQILFIRKPFPLALCQAQSILLSYGTDPNKTTHSGSRLISYPVYYYVTECQWEGIYCARPSMVQRCSHVLRLLEFMDSRCAAEAGKMIIEYCHELLGRGMPAEPLEEIQNSVWRVLHEARTLLSLSQLAVWKAIGRNFHAAETRKWLKRNIPQKILHDLDNMFVCNCQY